MTYRIREVKYVGKSEFYPEFTCNEWESLGWLSIFDYDLKAIKRDTYDEALEQVEKHKGLVCKTTPIEEIIHLL